MRIAFFFAMLALIASPAVAGVAEDADAIRSGAKTSEQLVTFYLQRIEQVDRKGPKINAVLALNPDALAQARALDAETKTGKLRGPLHGVPILIKDNIESADNMPTTAGSLALKDNVTGRDAPLIARLRSAGAIILGKTNLSEWANIRSEKSTSGWSALGGLTRNPHVLDRNSCGSSAGSGAAMAASLAAGTVGTETDGSIVCPSGINGIVGFKPTVGLVSRRHVVPISHSQDTAGPMTLSVRDAAIMLSAMAGGDPGDPETAEADVRKVDYVLALSTTGLSGLRIGVIKMPGHDPKLFDAALARMKAAGALVKPITYDPKDMSAMNEAEFKVLLVELKADLAAYLQSLPPGKVAHKTLADVIAFNNANAATELRYFGQDIFESAQKQPDLSDPEYRKARADSLRLAGAEGIDKLLVDNAVDLIVAQTNGAAWVTTLGKGDAFTGPSASTLPAIAGYPHLTVPMGATKAGLPIGLSIIGPKWSDAKVLAAGHAFEMAGPSLRVKPRYRKTVRAN